MPPDRGMSTRVVSLFISCLLVLCTLLDLSAATDTSQPAEYDGSLCFFADLNLDRYTDVLAISSEGQRVVAYLAAPGKLGDETLFDSDARWSTGNLSFGSKMHIVSCAVADFNDDHWPDLMVGAAESDDDLPTMLRVCYGKPNNKGFDCATAVNFSSVESEPLIIDYNADGIADVLYISNEKPVVHLGTHKREFTSVASPLQGSASLDAHFMHAFVDVRSHTPSVLGTDRANDMLADLVLGTTNGAIELWQMQAPTEWRKVHTIVASDKKLFDSKARMSTLALGDFNADGFIDLLRVIASDVDHAGDVAVQVWSSDEGVGKESSAWMDMGEIATSSGSTKLTLVPDTFGNITVRVGDSNSDGYPDLMLLVREVTGGPKSWVIAYNTPCRDSEHSDEADDRYCRKFTIDWDSYHNLMPLGARDLDTTAFFDVLEDGVLDVLIEYNTEMKHFWTADVRKQLSDATFVKAEVYTSGCQSPCENRQGEGTVISLAGATLYYESKDDEGEPIKGSIGQQPQAGRRALALPFAVFGLGRSPNFVERLYAGTPGFSQKSTSDGMPEHIKYWEQIVPNMRMFIVPPRDDDESWLARQYITPSKLVLVSLAAMCSLFTIILLIIAGLWWKERKDDERELRAQSTRFDFNAM